MSNKWECPMCGSRAYQRYGGISLPAKKIEIVDNKKKTTDVSFKTGTHFMCKGCSVFFGNPKLFNKNKDGNE